MPTPVVLLGPQHVSIDAHLVLRDLGITGRIALITAGWQEREDDDAALIAGLGVPAVNLRLHARAEEVFAADAPLREAYKERQELLRHLQTFYRVRLDHTDAAAHAISVRHVEPELLAQEWQVSVELFRQLDRDHLERCRAIHTSFETRWQLGTRPVVARHRRELGELVSGAAAVVIAGGHVASLLNRLKLFDIIGLAAGKPVLAWSAGAMVLTDRIVLFHDFPPYGSDLAQVLDAGFGLVSDLVVLPDPRRRIRIDDHAAIARFTQRMAPSTCLALDHGAVVIIEGSRILRGAAEKLTTTGQVDTNWAGVGP